MSFRTVFKRLMAERLAFASLIYLALLVIVAITAPWIAPHDPAEIDLMNMMKPPSKEHWFGTDELGRDIFSRVLMGAETAVKASLFAVLVPPRGSRAQAPCGSCSGTSSRTSPPRSSSRRRST